MICLNIAHSKYFMPFSIFLRVVRCKDANRRHAVKHFANAFNPYKYGHRDIVTIISPLTATAKGSAHQRSGII